MAKSKNAGFDEVFASLKAILKKLGPDGENMIDNKTLDHWNEDTTFTMADWAQEVQARDTLRGYWDWVQSKKEEQQNDEDAEVQNG